MGNDRRYGEGLSPEIESQLEMLMMPHVYDSPRELLRYVYDSQKEAPQTPR